MSKANQNDALDDFGRFSEPALLILISLADGPETWLSTPRTLIPPATSGLDRGRAEERWRDGITRLIEPLKSDDRRNPYRLTALGQRALRARLDAMAVVVRTGLRSCHRMRWRRSDEMRD